VDVLVYDDNDRRYVPLLVALSSALLAGLVIGGVGFGLGRSNPIQPVSGVTEPQAAQGQSPVAAESTCAALVERADAALGVGARLETALAEQTSVMDELLAQRASSEQVLDRALPPLTAAAKDRQAFLAAVTAYQDARASCEQ
jgi:hypothetical protein